MSSKVTIATRESQLALWQAEHVAALLQDSQPGLEVNLLGMTTSGDQMQSSSLSKIGGKGLFVKELELALMDGRADIAVHSGKDVPMRVPDGMRLCIVDKRADSRDALVLPSTVNHDGPIEINSLSQLEQMLPSDPCIGTSSLRRQASLRSLFAGKQIRVEELRGNLQTRLRKLDEGQFDAIVLATAGLERLDLGDRIAAKFQPSLMLPAVAQGALAIEYSAGKADFVEPLLESLIDCDTTFCVEAERACNLVLEGSCQVPIAVHAEFDSAVLSDGGRQLRIQGFVASGDGGEFIKENATVELPANAERSASIDKARSLGVELAESMLQQGARRLLSASLA